MKMNRRNALLGLGAIATGGGALFGSGAFSQVEAERTVTISASDDSTANLQLNIDTSSSAVADGGSDAIQLDLSNVNVGAVTQIDQVLEINVTSSASGTSYTIDVYEDFAASNSITLADGNEDTSSSGDTFQLVRNDTESSGTAGGSGGTTGLSPGNSVFYDVVLNTRGTTTASSVSLPSAISDGIVVQAIDTS